MLHIGVVTLMPEMFDSLAFGVTGRALDNGLAQIAYWNLRDYGQGNWQRVDDRPYGGGPGMVMMYEPLRTAIEAARNALPPGVKTISPGPQGKIITQSSLAKIARDKTPLLFIAGRYEGIDERIIDSYVDEEWSIGDYVLSGGELAAMVCIDAILRLLPGSLGNSGSAEQDSFSAGLLDYPHYTRPAIVDGLAVPEVLMTGDHEAIARWRRKQALGNTWKKRPDLLKKLDLTANDEALLAEFKNECNLGATNEYSDRSD